MKNRTIKNLPILIVLLASMILMGSCVDLDKAQEMRIKEVTVNDITSNSAIIKIHKNNITNGYKYVDYPNSTRLYYGTTPNVSEMTDFVVGKAGRTGLLDDQLVYYIQDLREDTEYWYAIKVDTIYANAAFTCVNLVNNQGDKGFLIPNDNSFTTAKNLPPVDLGLSVLWAQCDLGVDEIWYNKLHYWCVSKYNSSEIPTVMSIAGTTQDNVTAIMGEEWHTPTVQEYTELVDNCDWELKMNDEWGAYIRFTSRINGNHIDMYPYLGGKTAKWSATYWTSNVSDLSDKSSWSIYQFTFSSLQINATDWFTSVKYSSSAHAQIRPVKKK